MTQTQDPYQAENDEQARAAKLREVFGDDIFVGLATDEPVPNRRPLGQRIVQDQRRARREARKAERDERIATARDFEADQTAYDKVVVRGEDGTVQEQRAADRHIARHNLVPRKPTTQRLIDQSRATYDPMTDAD